MAEGQRVYIICNPNTDIGKSVAYTLLDENYQIILAGPDYSALKALQKQLDQDGFNHVSVALLEPSKEIDWKNLIEILERLDNQLAGIIHVHENESTDPELFEMDYEMFSAKMDAHLWGTYVGAKHIVPLLHTESSGSLLHLVETMKEDDFSMYNAMIKRALDAMLTMMAKELKESNLNIKYIEVDDASLKEVLLLNLDNTANE